MKMDGRRLLGLSIVIFAFAIVDTSAQNFYPTRYGKREGRAAEERWPRGSQYERRSDGNLFFGSRYGKRSYKTTHPGPLSEGSPASAGDRYGRSPDSTGADRFFFGSRFGKRSQRRPSSNAEMESEHVRSGDSKEEYLVCRYTGFRHLYHCLNEIEGDQTDEKVL